MLDEHGALSLLDLLPALGAASLMTARKTDDGWWGALATETSQQKHIIGGVGNR